MAFNQTEWERIEQEAREQVSAELQAADETPMDYGRVVAWSECRFGRTDGLSVVHRVGDWNPDSPSTICGEMIPAAIRRVSLNQNVARTLGRCKYCETAYAQKGVAA